MYTTRDWSDRAVDGCLDYLRHVGIEWSPHPTAAEARYEYDRMWTLLGGREIEELIDLPLMNDSDAQATLEVLAKALTPAAYTDGNLNALLLWRMVNLSIEHGNTDASCQAYAYTPKIAGPSCGSNTSRSA